MYDIFIDFYDDMLSNSHLIYCSDEKVMIYVIMCSSFLSALSAYRSSW